MSATIKILWADLQHAMEDHSGETEWYLDSQSGEVHLLTLEFSNMLDRLQTEASDPETSLEAILADLDKPDWIKEELTRILPVYRGRSDAYVPIEPTHSSDAWQDMYAFGQAQEDAHLRDRLLQALDGSGAFRRFKDELHADLDVRQAWFNYAEALQRTRALKWLSDQGIEAELI
jgi:hypothetical protein